MENTTTTQVDNAMAFVGGYLAKEDITGQPQVTIRDVRAEAIEGSPRPKLVVTFDELVKPLILNSTNIRRISAIVGTPQLSAWPGTRLTLYVDPNVEFGGKLTGGLRVAEAVQTVPTNGAAHGYQQQQNGIAVPQGPEFL